MKRKFYLLICLLFVSISLLTYTAIATLTDISQTEETFIVDKVEGEITVTSDSDVCHVGVNEDYNVSIKGLTYLDLKKDFPNAQEVQNANSTSKLINYLGTEVTIKLQSSCDIPVRPYVHLFPVNGVIPLVLDKEEVDYYTTIMGILNEVNVEYVDMREAIASYNYNYLKNLYENSDNILTKNGYCELKIVFFGDYYGLSSEQQASYLSQTFNLNISLRLVQDKEQLGGICSYDVD